MSDQNDALAVLRQACNEFRAWRAAPNRGWADLDERVSDFVEAASAVLAQTTPAGASQPSPEMLPVDPPQEAFDAAGAVSPFGGPSNDVIATVWAVARAHVRPVVLGAAPRTPAGVSQPSSSVSLSEPVGGAVSETAGAVLTAAQRIAVVDCEDLGDDKTWDELPESGRASYLAFARAALDAPHAVGETREEWKALAVAELKVAYEASSSPRFRAAMVAACDVIDAGVKVEQGEDGER